MQHFCPVSQGWKYLFPHDWLPAILKKESLGKSSHRSPRGCCQSLAFCFPPSLSGSTSAKSGPPLFPLSISVISGDRSHGAGSKRSISWQSASPAKWSALFFRASVIAVFLVHLGHHDNTASAPNPSHLVKSSSTNEQKSKRGRFLDSLPRQKRGSERCGPSTDEGPQVLPLKRFVASCFEKGVLNMKRSQTGKLQNKL